MIGGTNEVIPCWNIALPELRIGQMAEIICPPELAYKNKVDSKIP